LIIDLDHIDAAIRIFDPSYDLEGIRRRELHGYQPGLDVVSRWPSLMAAGGSIRGASRGSKIKSKPDNYSARVRQGRFDFPNT
jgi:hypothetical protein